MSNCWVDGQITGIGVLLPPCVCVVVDHEHFGAADRYRHLQSISTVVKPDFFREQSHSVEDLLFRAVRECERKKVVLPCGHRLSSDQSNIQNCDTLFVVFKIVADAYQR